jgi:hypothetical protein
MIEGQVVVLVQREVLDEVLKRLHAQSFTTTDHDADRTDDGPHSVRVHCAGVEGDELLKGIEFALPPPLTFTVTSVGANRGLDDPLPPGKNQLVLNGYPVEMFTDAETIEEYELSGGVLARWIADSPQSTLELVPRDDTS